MPVYYLSTIIKTFSTKLPWPPFPTLGKREGLAGDFEGGEVRLRE